MMLPPTSLRTLVEPPPPVRPVYDIPPVIVRPRRWSRIAAVTTRVFRVRSATAGRRSARAALPPE
jgi:hypothetical protein